MFYAFTIYKHWILTLCFKKIKDDQRLIQNFTKTPWINKQENDILRSTKLLY